MKSNENLTVYLGSSGRASPVYKDAAIELGKALARHKKKLVYGGMDAGLMGALAKAALESGAHVTGIIPRKIKDSERILPNLSKTIMVEELWDRKKKMFLMADTVISLPGGFGTLDESLEVLYWGHLGLHNKRLILVNIEDYWSPLLPYLQSLPDFDPQFLRVVSTVEEVFDILNEKTVLSAIEEPSHFPHFEDEITRKTNEPLIIDRATIENTYFAICALGLKQLGKHDRAIGFLNSKGQFDGLIEWMERAARETFITEKCLLLFNQADNRETLGALLDAQKTVFIDLHAEKWGE